MWGSSDWKLALLTLQLIFFEILFPTSWHSLSLRRERVVAVLSEVCSCLPGAGLAGALGSCGEGVQLPAESAPTPPPPLTMTLTRAVACAQEV